MLNLTDMKYFQLIIGCQMNYSDAERLAKILEAHGYHKTKDEAAADLIVVISCTVRQKAMDRIFGRLKKWRHWRKKRGVKTVLTGCVLTADRKKLQKEFDIFIEIKDIAKLPSLLVSSQISNNNGLITNADYLALMPDYTSEFQAYVPIMTGCNNYCTFCAVPYARGQEASRPASEIIKEVKGLINKGYKEITLLGQNVNAYIDPEKAHSKEELKSRSRDFWQYKKNQPIQWRAATTKVPKDFPSLIKKINDLPGDFWIRFITSNPQDVSDELLKALPKCDKTAKYFHLPVQSGDNKILSRMNRRHTREYYLELVKKIRRAWPGVTLTTDIIVGFPGEKEKHFQNTAELMRQVKYDMAYLAEYSPRPGTTAARFFKDDVTKKKKSQRKNELNVILQKSALEINQQLIGKKARVLVESYDKKNKINSGKTEGLKNIRFKGINLIGHFALVEVTKANAWNLAGQLIKKADVVA